MLLLVFWMPVWSPSVCIWAEMLTLSPPALFMLFQIVAFHHAGELLRVSSSGEGTWILVGAHALHEAGAIKLGERLPVPNSGGCWKVTAAGQAYMEEHAQRWARFYKSMQPWKDFMQLRCTTCLPAHAAKLLR